MNQSDPARNDDVVPIDEHMVEPDEATTSTAPQESSDEHDAIVSTEDLAEMPKINEPKLDEYGDPVVAGGEWQLWPPSPKMQILLIALMFGLFNFILLGIWAAIMVYRFN